MFMTYDILPNHKNYSMAKALITGITGMVGSHLMLSLPLVEVARTLIALF
jgi:hypothetical protein